MVSFTRNISLRIWTNLAVLLSSLPLSAQLNVDLQSQMPFDDRLSDIWGYTAGDGHEYALVGVFNGLSIVDLADPADPVEVQFIGGPESIWRDIKTWNDHAYVVNETDGGLLIVDLSGLPASVDTSHWTVDSFSTAHNIFIDENGVAYICGLDVGVGGVLMTDLSADPEFPVKLGLYNARYVHDCYARGDTLWTAEIANGQFAVIDVSDKSNPVVWATQNSPTGFTHNCWLSDDGATLFISDEYFGSAITSYDVSDLSDITELDQYRSSPGTDLIPHNAFVKDDWLVISYYRDGVRIVDISDPSNMVEVGNYDTSPFDPAGAFNGCWGVYPYFPSNTIVASDIEEGLFVLKPEYIEAARLEGTVKDALTTAPLLYAKVEIMGTLKEQITDFTGEFAMGVADSGRYDIRISRSGCETKILTGELLDNGQVNQLDVFLSCTTTAVNTAQQTEHLLLRAVPNVFNSHTIIEWEIPARAGPGAMLRLIDYSGRLIRQIRLEGLSGSFPLGDYLNQGVYVAQMATSEEQISVRLIKN